MRLNGYHCALGVLLSVTLLLLAFSTVSLIGSLRSQYHTGLDRSLCKCELSRGHQDRRSIQPRIVNGTAFTSRHGLPWIASVYYHGPLKLLATLVKVNVETADDSTGNGTDGIGFVNHCTGVAAGSNHDLRELFCDKIFTGPGGARMCDFRAEYNYTKKVGKIYQHPRRGVMFDIGLLEIEPFSLSEELNILPGCLFESNDYSFGDRLIAAGYGLTNSPLRHRSSAEGKNAFQRTKGNETIILMNDTKLYTTQLSQTSCEVYTGMEEWNETFEGNPRTLCATSNFRGASTCLGDSGGPLHFGSSGKQFIVGINSLITTLNDEILCDPGTIVAYTRVYPHLDWIRNVLGDDRCITNAFQLEPAKLWPHLQAVALAILSIALITHLIVVELKKRIATSSSDSCPSPPDPTA